MRLRIGGALFGLLFSFQLAFGAELSDLKLTPTVKNALTKARGQEKTPFDVKQWIDAVLKNDKDEAAHLWTHIQNQLPKNIKQEANAAFLVQLAQLEVSQTFFDQLITFMGQKSFTKSKAWKELEIKLQPIVADALVKEGIFLRQDQKSIIENFPTKGIGGDLKAWARRDNPKASNLTNNASLRAFMVPKKVLDLGKNGSAEKAIDLIEEELESPQLSSDNQSLYNLQLARLYFQMADLEQAEAAYLRVAENSPSIHEAREELLWVWLRKGDHGRLRGAISSMQLGKYENSFYPELFVVRAISNLKLCRFDDAKDDFGNFITYNKDWANKIEKALKESTPPKPPYVDMFTQLMETAAEKRKVEAEKVKTIREESVKASAPAVGVQKHWKEAEGNLKAQIARLEKSKEAEYRRIWRNQSVMLQEAIRKMKFVKVELLSQVQQGATPKPDSEASQKSAEEALSKVEDASKGRWVFPFDGVAWPDEVFAARSTANNICL